MFFSAVEAAAAAARWWKFSVFFYIKAIYALQNLR
jgi:hypothetical protein